MYRRLLAASLTLALCVSCGGNKAEPETGNTGGGSPTPDGGSGNTSGPATMLRFASVPTSAVAGEPFEVSVAVEDGRGNPAVSSTPVTLTVQAHSSGVVLEAAPSSATAGVVRFVATLDRDALGVVLVAAMQTLQVKSNPIDVRATRDQADWQLVGIEGAELRALLSSPADPRALVAVDTDGGLFVTTDAAASWARPRGVGLPSGHVFSAAWCSDGSLYVDVFDSGVYRSRDRAATFQRMGDMNGFVFCDASGARPFVFQTTHPPELWRWDGATFALVPSGPQGFVSAAPDGRTFFATSPPGGVVRSTDGGATWSATALTHNAQSVLAISAEIALATGFDGAVQRTADGGATWAPALSDRVAALARGAKGAVIALGDAGLRRSIDGGANWTAPAAVPPGQAWVSVADTEGGTWLASRSAVYVLERESFRLATHGMGGLAAAVYSDPRTGFLYAAYDVGLYRFTGSRPWELIFPGSIGEVTFDPSSSGAMFAGTWDGIFRSTDAGSTWSKVPGAPGVPFAAPDGRTWYAYNVGLWRSDDAGSSWSQVWRWNIGSPRVSAMAFDGDVIVFGSAAQFGKELSGVFRSEDRGATYALTMSGSTRQLVQVGSSLLVPSEVSRSDDSGRTFTALFPKHTQISWLALDGGDARTMVALDRQFLAFRPPALYRSADGGSTWSRCLSGLDRFQISQIQLDPGDGTVLYAATNHGVFRSTDACPKR